MAAALAMALSACTAKEAAPPAAKSYSKPASTELCASFDYGLLAEVLSDLSTGQDKDSMNEAGLSCTRSGARNLLSSTIVVMVATYDDAGGATRTHEGDLKRYGIPGQAPKQLTQLAGQVEKAALISGRPGDDWLYLDDGNMRIIIHITGPFPRTRRTPRTCSRPRRGSPRTSSPEYAMRSRRRLSATPCICDRLIRVTGPRLFVHLIWPPKIDLVL
jgi:hypothetical protein